MAQIISLGSSDTLGNSGVNGKVGINTTAAETPLHVVGAVSVQNDTNVTSFISNSGTSKIYTSSYGGTYPFDNNGNLVIQPRTASGSGGDIVFASGKTTPSTRMVIKEAGNVGVGTTSPAEKLDVGGNIKASGDIKLAGNWAAGRLVLGNYYLWVDTNGKLRIENGAPSNDGAGTVVGTQT